MNCGELEELTWTPTAPKQRQNSLTSSTVAIPVNIEDQSPSSGEDMATAQRFCDTLLQVDERKALKVVEPRVSERSR
jgi:hypothetical protein